MRWSENVLPITAKAATGVQVISDICIPLFQSARIPRFHRLTRRSSLIKLLDARDASMLIQHDRIPEQTRLSLLGSYRYRPAGQGGAEVADATFVLADATNERSKLEHALL